MGIIKLERGKGFDKNSVVFQYGERLIFDDGSKRPILKIEGYDEKEPGKIVYNETKEC